MVGIQSFESVLPEALLPANDGGRRGLELFLDGTKGRAFLFCRTEPRQFQRDRATSLFSLQSSTAEVARLILSIHFLPTIRNCLPKIGQANLNFKYRRNIQIGGFLLWDIE